MTTTTMKRKFSLEVAAGAGADIDCRAVARAIRGFRL